LHKTLRQKEHMTLPTYQNEIWHTTRSSVFLKQSLLLVSCPNRSVHVWACSLAVWWGSHS